ncbi:FeoB-associated Cys-rich membrane protein [Lacinutrix chionoecetis]
MARISIRYYDGNCVYCSIISLSIFKVMNSIFQNIIVFTILGFALFYLAKKFFWKKKSDKACGTDDCGCH